MKEIIRKECKLEIVPPVCHRRNLAELSIKAFKHNFISILSGVDASFPLALCDKLLPQAELTLNLLRQSHTIPTVSAHAHLHGNFDYNRMPLSPLGCAVQLREDTDKWGSWVPHTVDGWYLGTPPEHYRSHIIYLKIMRSERVSETVFFKHKYLTNPTVSHADRVIAAAKALYSAMGKAKRGMSDSTMQALQSLIRIYVDTAERESGSAWKEENTTQVREPPPPATSPPDE